jgi:hypothetical protein
MFFIFIQYYKSSFPQIGIAPFAPGSMQLRLFLAFARSEVLLREERIP